MKNVFVLSLLLLGMLTLIGIKDVLYSENRLISIGQVDFSGDNKRVEEINGSEWGSYLEKFIKNHKTPFKKIIHSVE